MTRMRNLCLASVWAAALFVLLGSTSAAAPAAAQTSSDLEQCRTIPAGSGGTCPSTYVQPELCQPRVIPAVRGVLDTKIDVAKKTQCVPTSSDGKTWAYKAQELRNYGVPDADGVWQYGFPAPTFRMQRKPDLRSPIDGDRFKMLLTNSMGETTVEDQMKCTGTARFANDTHPNCFHGNETTNFHFHGFHVSPQPLQDYVLLKIYPQGLRQDDPPKVPVYDPKMSNEELAKLTDIVGAYRYDVDPLPYNQPEGTHWYHAHHHGATAMQVINGMAGTFLIEGPFDKWLNDRYGYRDGKPILKDRLFVVQQINDSLASTTTLINGQGNPIVPIRPGEVQRWRFVSATTQASAQLDLQFQNLEVCQIQMDGVQFGPENYGKQPLLRGEPARSPWCRKNVKFELSPGNRADFLVRLPAGTEDDDGMIEMMQEVIGGLADDAQELEGVRMELPDELPLMTLRMMDPAEKEMAFPNPADWPKLPPWLAPPEPRISKSLAYQMFRPAGNNPAPIFMIDGQQVPEVPCVPEKLTVTRGVDERWTVRNQWNSGPAMTQLVLPMDPPRRVNRGIAHPFHIHTNPFYVVRDGNREFKPGIWQDTIALPLAMDDDQDKERASSVELLMEFEDYTGGYVQHCHILGHEDRGMMTLVQTLCDDGKRNWGTPVANRPDDCAKPINALPICKP